MKPETAEKWMTILMRLNGLILASALFTVFLPNGVMHSIHEWLGLGQMPESSITEYLARSTSLLYAVHGFVLITLFWHPRRHWQLVPVFMTIHLAIGGFMLGIDLKSQMPWFWTACEGPPIMAFSLIVIWLWKTANAKA